MNTQHSVRLHGDVAGEEHPNRSIILSLFGGAAAEAVFWIGFRLQDLDFKHQFVRSACWVYLPDSEGKLCTYQGFLLELVEIIPNVMNR